MAEGGGLSGVRRSPSFDVHPLTPPLERFLISPEPRSGAAASTGAVGSSTTSGPSNPLNPRSSHSLSRLGPGLASPTVAALQRFATYSPRHDLPFPSPPPSPITLRSLRVRDDCAATRAALHRFVHGGLDDEDVVLSSSATATAASSATAGVVLSPHHPHHPVRKRLSQRLAAWSKNFKAKFKKSAASSSSAAGAGSADVTASLKQELLMDRVVASDGRSCTLTRRHQLSSDLPALLRSSSSSPRPSHHHPHQPLHDFNATLALGGGSGGSPSSSRTRAAGDDRLRPGASLPMAVERSSSSKRDPISGTASSSHSRTPVGIVQSSAFIVTTAPTATSSPTSSSSNKMMRSLVVESSSSPSSSSRYGVDDAALSTSIRSEGGVPLHGGLFDRRRDERFTDDDDGDDDEEDDDDDAGIAAHLVDEDDEASVIPPPELPPRRRRVHSTDNILELPSDRSFTSAAASSITTSLTTDDVAALRDGGAGAVKSTSDAFAKSIERLKECGSVDVVRWLKEEEMVGGVCSRDSLYKPGR